MTLAALLEELRGADPEQSEKLQCWIGRTRQFMNLEVPLECDLAQALIQASIQRACERRGWTWRVFRQTPDHEKSHCGEIGEIAPGYYGDSREQCHEYCIASIEADSAAEALLAAYIAAVKEEEKK
jgi:hypothetical protein